MTEYILKTLNLNAGYGGVPVTEHIDLQVRKGEILTFIGPNGSGKTTLLRTLAKQLEPVAGTVLLEEEDLSVTKASELARHMAVVFSDALRPEQMTCREAVAVGRYPYTGAFGKLSSEDDAVIDRAMEQVQVKDLKDRPFTAISDGQRQRVVLARALAQEPEVILLDEPTTFLDIRWKAEFLEALQRLSREEGMTVLLTLHEPDLARQVSDRVACMKEGRLDRVGTPSEIFDGTYIAELFGITSELYGRWF